MEDAGVYVLRCRVHVRAWRLLRRCSPSLRLAGRPLVHGRRVAAWKKVMSKYADMKFWEKKYQEKDPITLKMVESYDWYVDAEDLAMLVDSYLMGKFGAKILIPGCGSSLLPRVLYKMGYKNLFCIDFCAPLIHQLQQRDGDMEGSEHFIMDATNLTMFPNNFFDAVIDKACLDAVMSGDNSVDGAHDMLEEVSRTLAVGGMYLSVSYAPSEARFPHMKKPMFNWTVGLSSLSAGVDNDITYNVYVCTKTEAHPQAGLEPPTPPKEERKELKELTTGGKTVDQGFKLI